jgi:hypothetical protein
MAGEGAERRADVSGKLMAIPTALDTLKDTLLRADNLISYAQDQVAGSLCAEDDHEPEQEALDGARKMLWDAVAAHVRGVRFEHPHFTDAGYKAMHTYDDGSVIVEHIELAHGSVATYFPRHDGNRGEFIERLSAGLRPNLTIVSDEGGRSNE